MEPVIPAAPTTAAPETTTVARARRLLLRATTTAVVSDLVLMALIVQVIPPIVVFAVLTVIAIAVLRRRPAPLAIVLAMLALAHLVGGWAHVADGLTHPSDVTSFVWAALSGGGRVVTVVAAGLLLRRADAAARGVGRVAIAGIVATVAVAGVARATVSSEVAEPGDVPVAATNTTYPDTITVTSGQTLFVDNQDEWRHTFTVEGTGVNVDLPPTADRRVAIDLPPGSYVVRCTVPGHENMTSTLEVR